MSDYYDQCGGIPWHNFHFCQKLRLDERLCKSMRQRLIQYFWRFAGDFVQPF